MLKKSLSNLLQFYSIINELGLVRVHVKLGASQELSVSWRQEQRAIDTSGGVQACGFRRKRVGLA